MRRRPPRGLVAPRTLLPPQEQSQVLAREPLTGGFSGASQAAGAGAQRGSLCVSGPQAPLHSARRRGGPCRERGLGPGSWARRRVVAALGHSQTDL